MARVDVDEVEAGLERAAHGGAVPSPEIVDVRERHPPRLDGLVAVRRQVIDGHRRLPAVEVRADAAVVDELDARERPVLVHLLDHPGERRDVLVVPEPALGVRGDLGGGVDLDLLGADDGPAALGLDAAHERERRRVAVAHPVAVRHLEEAVARGDGPDPDGLEEDVVAGIAGDGRKPNVFDRGVRSGRRERGSPVG